MRRIGPSVGHSRLYSGLIDKLVIIYFHLFILFHYYFCFIQLCRPMAVARRLIEINGMFLLLERRGIVVYRRLVRTVGGEVPLRGGEFCLRLVVTTSKPWDSAFFIFCFPFPFFILLSGIKRLTQCPDRKAAVAFQVSQRCGFLLRSPVISTPVMELFF